MVQPSRLAWSGVELGGHRGQLFGTVHAQIAALWEVLTHNPLVFSFDSRCHGLAFSQKNTGMPSVHAISVRSAKPEP